MRYDLCRLIRGSLWSVAGYACFLGAASAQVGHFVADTHGPNVPPQDSNYLIGLDGGALLFGQTQTWVESYFSVPTEGGSATPLPMPLSVAFPPKWMFNDPSGFSPKALVTDGYFCVSAFWTVDGVWCSDGTTGTYVSTTRYRGPVAVDGGILFTGEAGAPDETGSTALFTDGTIAGSVVIPLPDNDDGTPAWVTRALPVDGGAWLVTSGAAGGAQQWLRFNATTLTITAADAPVEVDPVGYNTGIAIGLAGRAWAAGQHENGQTGVFSWDLEGAATLEFAGEPGEIFHRATTSGSIFARNDGAHLFASHVGGKTYYDLPFRMGSWGKTLPTPAVLDWVGDTVHLFGAYPGAGYSQFDVPTGELSAVPNDWTSGSLGALEDVAIFLRNYDEVIFAVSAKPAQSRVIMDGSGYFDSSTISADLEATLGDAAPDAANAVFRRRWRKDAGSNQAWLEWWKLGATPDESGPLRARSTPSDDGPTGAFVSVGGHWAFHSTNPEGDDRLWLTDGTQDGTQDATSDYGGPPLLGEGPVSTTPLPSPDSLLWNLHSSPTQAALRRFDGDYSIWYLASGPPNVGEGPFAAIDNRAVWKLELSLFGASGTPNPYITTIDIRTGGNEYLWPTEIPGDTWTVDNERVLGNWVVWVSHVPGLGAELIRLRHHAPFAESVILRPGLERPDVIHAMAAAHVPVDSETTAWVAAHWPDEPSASWYELPSDGSDPIERFAPVVGAPQDIIRPVATDSHIYFAGKVDSEWFLWVFAPETSELTPLLSFGAELDAHEWVDAVTAPFGIVFSHGSSAESLEPWVAGPSQIPQPLGDLAPGESGSKPLHLLAAGDWVYFSADTPAYGREMWRTDGTTLGTTLAIDHLPGPESGVEPSMGHPVPIDAGILYAPRQPLVGREPYTLCHDCLIDGRCWLAGQSRAHDPCSECDTASPTAWKSPPLSECAPTLYDAEPNQIGAGEYAEYAVRGYFGPSDSPISVTWPDATIGGAQWESPDRIRIGARAPWVTGFATLSLTIHTAEGDFTATLDNAIEVLGTPPCPASTPGCRCETATDCSDIDICTYEVCSVGLCKSAPHISCCADPVLCNSCAGKGQTTGAVTFNVTDIQCGILLTLWIVEGSSEPAPACQSWPLDRLDMNCDNAINVSDLVLQISKLLGVQLPADIDQNGNGCVDACQ